MAGLVGEDTVDVRRSPPVVGVVHHQERSAEDRVREVLHRVLREEGDVRPVGAEPRPKVLGVGTGAGMPGPEPERGERRVTESRLVVRRRRVRRNRQPDDVDVPAPRDRLGRMAGTEPAEAVLRLGDHGGAFGGGELQGRGGPLDDHRARRRRCRTTAGWWAARPPSASAAKPSSAGTTSAQPGVVASATSHGSPASGRDAFSAR